MKKNLKFAGLLMLSTALMPVPGYTSATLELSSQPGTSQYVDSRSGADDISISSSADLTFNSGFQELWAYYSYVTNETAAVTVAKIGGDASYTPDQLTSAPDNYSGNVIINGGTISDSSGNGIRIYKGLDTAVLPDGSHDIYTNGGIIIHAGTFNFNNTQGEILLRASAKEDFTINGGTFNVGGSGKALIGQKFYGDNGFVKTNKLYIKSGTLNIASGGILQFSGNNVQYGGGSTNKVIISDESAGILSFVGGYNTNTSTKTIQINDGINLSKGELNLYSGNMYLNADVAVKKFSFGETSEIVATTLGIHLPEGQVLNVDKSHTLTVSEDFVMKSDSQLVGDGSLSLSNGANATFGLLYFGTVQASGKSGGSYGTVTFTGKAILENLDVTGSSIQNNSNLTVNNLTLKANEGDKSILTLGDTGAALLYVDSFNIEGGNVVFNNNSQLYIRNDAIINELTSMTGTGTINFTSDATKGLGILEFKDSVEGSTGTISIANTIDLVIANGETVDFNLNKGITGFNKISVEAGTLKITQATNTFQKLVLGQASSVKSFDLQVAEGATVNFEKYAYVYPGAQLNIDGTLTINGTTDPAEYAVSGKKTQIDAVKGTETKVNGSGTLQLIGDVLSNASYNIGTLIIGDGTTTTTVTHSTRDSSSDWSSQHFAQNLTVNANSTLTIDGGELDTAGLSGNGAISINTNGILGIDSTSALTGVGSITGTGTLKLLNATNMTLSADSTSSLKVSIGRGILTIGTENEYGSAASTSATTFGSLSFNDSANGGSVVISNGSSLSLGSINVSGKSSLIGKGNLNLTGSTLSSMSGTGNLNINTVNASVGVLDVSRSGIIENLNALALQVNGANTKLNTTNLNATGAVAVNEGATLQVDHFITSSPIVVGKGTLIAGDGTISSVAGSYNGISYSQLANLQKSLEGTLTAKGSIDNVVVTKGTLKIIDTGLETNTISVNGSVISSDSAIPLTVNQSGSFVGDDTISGSIQLKAGGDVKFTFDGTNTLASYDMNNTNSVVQINQEGVLNLQDWSNETTDHQFTGAGILFVKKASGELKSTIENLGVLAIDASSFTLSSQLNNLGQLTLKKSGTTIASNGTIGSFTIDQTSTIVKGNLSVGKLTIAESSEVNGTLTITNKLDVQQATTGTGTFIIQSGSADFSAGFTGNLKIGSVANIKEDISLGNVSFISSDGGTLNIAEGKKLTLASLTTSGKNVVNGAGILAITNSGTNFGAPIGSLGKLELTTASSDATFNQSANISEISFASNSFVTVNPGYTLTVSTLSGIPKIQGNGTFSFVGTGTPDLNVGNGLGTLNIASGKIKIIEDGAIGNVSLSMGNLVVADGKFLTVNNLDGAGQLFAEGSNSAKLVINYSANFVKEVSNFDTITSKGRTIFQNGINVVNLNIDSGMTSINGLSNAITGTLTVDGVLDIGGYQKVNAGTVRFNTGSSLNLNINPESQALGQIHSSNVTINPNVSLNLKIGYGVKKDGMEFRVIDGAVPNGVFLTENNNRYALTNTNCSNGLCYKIVQTATGADVSDQSGGSKNDAAVARAVLDNEIFKPTDKFYPVAVQLYDLSLYGSAKEYREALTTIAPDVTGSAMKQSVDVQSKITNIAFSRLQHLGGSLGSKATNYNYKKAYGKSGGNYYKYRGSSRSSYRNSDLGDIKKYKRNNEYEYYRVKSTSNVQKYDAKKHNRYQDATPTTGRLDVDTTSRYQKYYGDSSSDPRRYEKFTNSYGVYENSGRIESTDPKKYMRSRDTILYQQEKTKTVLDSEKKYQRRILQPSSNGTVVADSMKYKHTGYQPFQNRVDFGVWAEGFYNTNEYKNESDADGFSSDTIGIATGMDITFLDMFAFGVGYSNSKTDLKMLNRKTDVDGNTLFMYGMVKPNNFYVSGFLGYTSNEYSERKDIRNVSTIEDNYDGTSVGAQINLGYDLGQWQPEIGVRYTNSKFDSRTDSVGQKIDSYSGTVGTALANVTYETDLRRTDADVVSADFRVGVSYDFKTAKQQNTVILENGSKYTVEGSSMDKFGVEVGTGISYKANNHIEFRAEYDCEYKKDFLSHSLKAHVRYNF